MTSGHVTAGGVVNNPPPEGEGAKSLEPRVPVTPVERVT